MTPDPIRLMADSSGASTLRGRALVTLREMLLRGGYPPGKRLEEIELSRRLGLSRPILRSALEHLSSEGLLTVSPAGGYAVRRFTLDDIRDAILARSALEGQAAGLASKRVQDPSELDSARKLNAEMAEAIASSAPDVPTVGEMSRFGDLNAAFHNAVVALARSPMLSWCLQRVQSAAFASPAAVVIPAEGDGARRAFQEHEEILRAIQAGDASRADALVRQHARLAIHAIECALQGQPHSSRNIALMLVGNKPAKIAVGRPNRISNRESAPGATSQRILDAAAELFCEKGFYAATTRELANRLQIQQASLYHHISNKEELLERICRPIMDRFLSEVPAALSRAGAGRSKITAFIDRHLHVALENPRHTLAMVSEFQALSRTRVPGVADRYTEYTGLLQRELVSAQEAGSLRSDISAKSIRLALLNILNWVPRWFRPSGALSSNELSSICDRLFWEGVINPKLREAPPAPPVPSPLRRHQSRDADRGTLGKFIRAAAELFSKYGYESTSTRDLAALLGMEKATLYYHVEGKEDLLYAICKSSIEQLNSDVDAAMDGIDDPLTQLQVWIQAHLFSLLRDQTQHATALAEARALTGERLTEIVAMRKTYQRHVRSLIAAGQKAGRLRTDIEAKYLGMMLEGLLERTVIWYRRNGELKPSELAEIFCSLFVSGARDRPLRSAMSRPSPRSGSEPPHN